MLTLEGRVKRLEVCLQIGLALLFRAHGLNLIEWTDEEYRQALELLASKMEEMKADQK